MSSDPEAERPQEDEAVRGPGGEGEGERASHAQVRVATRVEHRGQVL